MRAVGSARLETAMRRWIGVAGLIILTACGGDGTGPGGDTAYPIGVVTGTWTMPVTGDPACPGLEVGDELTVWIPGDENAISELGSLSFESVWGRGAAAVGSVIGTVNLRSGAVFLRLYGDQPFVGAALDGEINDSTLGFEGTLTDPYIGYAPIFTTGQCVLEATGSRTSDAQTPPGMAPPAAALP